MLGKMELLEKKYQKLIKGFVINKFRGDIDILRPSFQKLKQKTGKPILGTIPIMKFDIPDEDSLSGNAKQIIWNKKFVQYLDKEIENLSRVVKSSLNVKAIGDLIK